MLGETVQQQTQLNNIKKEMLWEELGILLKDDDPSRCNLIPEYVVSWIFVKQLLIMWKSEELTLPSVNKKVEIQRNTIKEVQKSILEHIDLVDTLRKNIPKLFSNKPVKLQINQLPEVIWSKFLAHCLAISAKKLPDYGDIYYNDDALLHNAKRIHDNLWDLLKEQVHIGWKPFDVMHPKHREIAERFGIINIAKYGNIPEREMEDDWSALITKELAIDILKQQPEFNYLFNDAENSEDKIDGHINLKVNTVAEEEKPQFTSSLEEKSISVNPTPKKRKKKSKTQTRLVLEQLVEYLIINGICNTYIEFRRWIVLHYMIRHAEKLADEDKFNDHSIVKNLYCIPARPQENKVLKHKKYIVHYSIKNETGTIIPQEAYSLSSFKNIFDAVITLRRINATKS
jgi:hypothetical protein